MMQPFLRRILCADDDHTTNELMQFWLAQNGYEVKTVETSSEALKLAQQQPFDLYLLDDWFPDGRGRDLIHQIRVFDPITPIVFLSGDVREANQAEILRLGAQAFLSKPTNLDQVTETIDRLILAAEQSLPMEWPA